MAKSRRRYITVENSFFERQPRIARHPTGDRNEDEKPRNLGVQSPPPLPLPASLVPLCGGTGYISQFAWANLSRNSYPSFLPRIVSFSPPPPLSYLSRIFVSSFFFFFLSRCVLVSHARANYFWIRASFLFHLSPILPISLMKLFKVVHKLAWQFILGFFWRGGGES